MLLPAPWRRRAWPAAALCAAGLLLWTWGSHRPLGAALATGLGAAAAMLAAGTAIERTAARGAWTALALVGLGTSVLLALTGSVRLSQEATLIAAPMLALAGRPLDADAAHAAGVLLAAAVCGGVVFSSLGYAALVPALCLAALPLGQRRGWLAPLAAAAIGLVLSAPVVIDWIREPPF